MQKSSKTSKINCKKVQIKSTDMKYNQLKTGKWYFTSGDATIKILDKLKDCFVVICYSFRHNCFWLDTYPYDEKEEFFEGSEPLKFIFDNKGVYEKLNSEELSMKHFK